MESMVQSETKEGNLNGGKELKDLNPKDAERGRLYQKQSEKGYLDFLRADPSKESFFKSGFLSRIFRFPFLRRSRSQTPSSSSSAYPDPLRTTASGGGGCGTGPFRFPFVKEINWGSLVIYCKKWVKHPMNMAILVWLFFVAACLVVLFLFMAGLLNQAIPEKSARNKWTEIFNQILNALFTIMCLYQHPRIFHHLVLLLQWGPDDGTELRGVYCKKGERKPHDRANMLFVVILLHLTCFAQYGLCYLFWAYTSKTRPGWPQILCIVFGTAAPVIAALYTFLGPLGKKTESENDEEAQRPEAMAEETELSEHKPYEKRVVVISPEWNGGLFECRNDPSVCCLSFFLTFFFFGWNMQRLGFGNMYVHTCTFILLCCAPVLVFGVTAHNVNDDGIRYIVGIAGILLCFFGFLYGGFWRIQMRKRFKLPANTFCFGYSSLTDFMQWLFCWSCSLAQEVRTANFYYVVDDSFCNMEAEEGGRQLQALSPLPRENGAGPLFMASMESSVRIHIFPEENQCLDNLTAREEGMDEIEDRKMMRAPHQPLISTK